VTFFAGFMVLSLPICAYPALNRHFMRQRMALYVAVALTDRA